MEINPVQHAAAGVWPSEWRQDIEHSFDAHRQVDVEPINVRWPMTPTGEEPVFTHANVEQGDEGHLIPVGIGRANMRPEPENFARADVGVR